MNSTTNTRNVCWKSTLIIILPKESPAESKKPPFQSHAEGTHLQLHVRPQLRRFTRTNGQIQPTRTFKHSNGPRRRERLQCRGGLGMVVQTHSSVEPLQILIGGFRQNHKVAEGEEMRRVRFQECQGGVDTSRIHQGFWNPPLVHDLDYHFKSKKLSEPSFLNYAE